ncbi:D-tyrosyl-tRNA(Tyr) deacylase [Dictyocaulus viviparus]|uniref:D-aminoacyl-tRNA deacylase n=1 Tax=Dictyocaulus viviparus TaxID=29172 RepID=A0A0D8Y667_DICVI|nr:D-tyrosyl-tRNA(Tyr) deacylase [Dictyocaulus viviparus]
MRAVVQRVVRASVNVAEEVVGSIGRGICVLVGISRDDNDDDIEYIVRKILNVRLFEADNKRWEKSVKDEQLEVLCVSQFTLHAYLKSNQYYHFYGNKLDFHNSMSPQDASVFYGRFMDKLRDSYLSEKVKDGRFASMMNVEIVNDGPVTIILDSKIRN